VDDQFETGLARGGLRDAACLTLVAAAEPTTVIDRFGGQPTGTSDVIPHPNADLHHPVIAVTRLPGWVLVIENNGWQGSRPEVLRRVSAGTRAISVYWSTAASPRLSYALDGVIVAGVNAHQPDAVYGADPASIREHLDPGVRADENDLVAALIHLAERVTGVSANSNWFTGPFLTATITPWLDDPTPATDLDLHPLTYSNGRLAWNLRFASPTHLAAVRDLAAAVIRSATDPIDLDIRVTDPAHLAGRAAAAALAGLHDDGSDAATASIVETAATCTAIIGRRWEPIARRLIGLIPEAPLPAGSLGLDTTAGTRRHEWILRHWLRPTGAISLIRGATTADVAGALNVDLGSVPAPAALTFPATAALGRIDDWVIAIETHPVTRPLTSRTLPAAAIIIHLRWQARGRAQLWYATAGDPTMTWDPQRLDATADDLLTTTLTGIPVPVGPRGTSTGYVPALLVGAERLSGLDLGPRALDRSYDIGRYRDRG
jgi:Family of unknown function (DUF6461)